MKLAQALGISHQPQPPTQKSLQWLQANLVRPRLFTQALLRLIKSDAADRFIGWPERLAVRLNGVLGPLLDSSFTNHRQALAQPAIGITDQPTLQGHQP